MCSWIRRNCSVCNILFLSPLCRCERLEEQLNDLTELHQNEILNLKQELASMEEKIAYQSYERARDIQVNATKVPAKISSFSVGAPFKNTFVPNLQEALEACQTRISKMELQQQQQQVVQLEGLENATARTLLGKLINVLLAVMAVLLVFVSTVANCVVPLMKTRSRTLSTLLLVILLAFLWRHWDAFSEYLHHFLLHPRWPACLGDEGTEGLGGGDADSYRESNLNCPTFSSSIAASPNTQEDCVRGLSLYHFVKCVFALDKTEYGGERARCLVLTCWHYCSCDTGTYCNGVEWGIFEGGAERTAHLFSLFWVNLFTCGKFWLVSSQMKLQFRVLLLLSYFKWYCFKVPAIF